jgi:RNA polymerase sigma-70 factor (ECF subfamily)
MLRLVSRSDGCLCREDDEPMAGTDEVARSSERGGSRFRTTRWTVVLAASGSDQPQARDAMATLCRVYWYPLYAFVRSRGSPPEEAEDLTQGFFAHLLEKDALRQVDPSKGRFRSFLLASFRNFLTDEWTKQRAEKRGGGIAPLSLDADAAEDRFALEPAHGLTPERIFERQWALTVIEQALARLQERYVRSGKRDHFEALKVFLSERRPVPQVDVARRLGLSELAVKVAIHRLRKRFHDALREEIAQTVATEQDVDRELRSLQAALDG